MATLRLTRQLNNWDLDHAGLLKLLIQDFPDAEIKASNTYPGPKYMLDGVSVDALRYTASLYLNSQGMDEGYGYEVNEDSVQVPLFWD